MIESLSPKQQHQLATATARLNLSGGAVRAGKTVGFNLKWIAYSQFGPPGPLAMIAKTERTLKRNILDPLREILGDRLRVNYGHGEAFLGKRVLYLVGANDERAKDKIQGSTLAGALGDEITTWPESFWTMLLSRLSVSRAQFFGTFNPDSPAHWLKRKVIDKAEELAVNYLHFELSDNPFLDPEFTASLKREYRAMGELWYKRYILGLWVLAEGAIYDMFSEEAHVRPWQGDPPSHYAVAVDYGNANPTAFGLYGYNRRPPVHKFREYHHDGREQGTRTPSQYADDLVAWLGDIVPAEIIVDPAALGFIAELRSRGLKVTGAKNDVLEGIRRVGQAYSNGEYTIDPGCKNTVMEAQGYIWDAKAAARGEDKPVKDHDHHMDADRYFWFTTFGKDDWTYQPTTLSL